MNSRLTQAAYCRTRHHGNSILFFPLRPPVPSITGRLIFPPLLPRHVKIAGRPLASREESHASLMRPRPSHRLQAYVAETPCSSLPCHRSPMGIPLISVFYSIFSSLFLSLLTVVRFSARSLSGFRIDFSCGGFWQQRENEEGGNGGRASTYVTT